MKAIKGRASFLGERSIGHMDPGRAVVVADDRRRLHRDGGMNVANVGIVIVSHSPKVAEGAADMVRQMVGDSVPLAWTGGNPEGGLGTDVAAIIEAIDRAWSDAGVAVLVDLGGAETNSEMAIEMLDPSRRDKVVVCEAPVVEGRGDGGHRSVRRRGARRGAAHRRGIVADVTPPIYRRPRAHDQRCASPVRALLTNDVGLHARPSVKLTQLAKRFGAQHRIRARRDRAVGRCQEPGEGHALQGRQGGNAALSRAAAPTRPRRSRPSWRWSNGALRSKPRRSSQPPQR